MAKRKSDLRINRMSGKKPADIRNTNAIEREILTTTLDRQQDIKNTPLNRYSGVKTEVTFFHQLLTDKNDYLVNVNEFNDIDPNIHNYAKVENFLIKMNTLDSSLEELEGGGTKSFEGSGSIIILPNTIQPLPKDYFTAIYRKATCLFVITDVKPITMDEDTAYECEYELWERKFSYDTSNLKGCVSTEYIFEQVYVGTTFRTLFRVDEYKALTQLKEFYTEMGDFYRDRYFNEILGTYILDYNSAVIINPPKNYAVATEDGIVYPKKEVRFTNEHGNLALYQAFNGSYISEDRYDGKEFYDEYLIDFLAKNKIFEDDGMRTIIPTQYIQRDKTGRPYERTLFHAVEKQNRKRFKYGHMLPIEIQLSTPATQPILFGKYRVFHTGSCSDECISLYPSLIYDRIHTEQVDFSVSETDSGVSLVDRISNIISLYVNKKEKHILQHLLYLTKNSDDIFDELGVNESFYLLPLLGYIIREYISNLINKSTSVNAIGDEMNDE